MKDIFLLTARASAETPPTATEPIAGMATGIPALGSSDGLATVLTVATFVALEALADAFVLPAAAEAAALALPAAAAAALEAEAPPLPADAEAPAEAEAPPPVEEPPVFTAILFALLFALLFVLELIFVIPVQLPVQHEPEQSARFTLIPDFWRVLATLALI